MFARRHPLATYFVLAYAFSWAYWVPMALLGYHVFPGSTTTHTPGLLGPALAAFVTAAMTGEVEHLRRKLFLVSRPSWRFWAYSLSPLAFLALALAVIRVTGGTVPGYRAFARYSGLPELGAPVVWTLVLILSGSGEEIGWRGFALPRLQERFGLLGGALVLALVWAGWHLPAFAIVQTYQAMTPVTVVFGFGQGLTAGSIALAQVTSATGGSVLAAALWHALYNITSATDGGQGIVGAVTTTCVMVWASVVVLVEWRKKRASQ